MKNYLVDTDIIIDCLRQEKPVFNFLKNYIEKKDGVFMISIVTRAELFSGESAQNPQGKHILQQLLDSFVEIPIETDIAETAGHFRFKYKTSLGDALIAASAYHEDAILLTRNIKHFRPIKEIQIG